MFTTTTDAAATTTTTTSSGSSSNDGLPQYLRATARPVSAVHSLMLIKPSVNLISRMVSINID